MAWQSDNLRVLLRGAGHVGLAGVEKRKDPGLGTLQDWMHARSGFPASDKSCSKFYSRQWLATGREHDDMDRCGLRLVGSGSNRDVPRLKKRALHEPGVAATGRGARHSGCKGTTSKVTAWLRPAGARRGKDVIPPVHYRRRQNLAQRRCMTLESGVERNAGLRRTCLVSDKECKDAMQGRRAAKTLAQPRKKEDDAYPDSPLFKRLDYAPASPRSPNGASARFSADCQSRSAPRLSIRSLNFSSLLNACRLTALPAARAPRVRDTEREEGGLLIGITVRIGFDLAEIAWYTTNQVCAVHVDSRTQNRPQMLVGCFLLKAIN